MIVLYENSPKTFKTYLRTNSFKYIEQVVGCRIKYVSVGASRDEYFEM